MVKSIQRFFFKNLSLDNYLRLLQRSYFKLHSLGILKFNDNYSYHYFVKKLINKGDTIVDIGANLGYYSIPFAKWTRSEGKVYSIEPIATYNKIFNEQAKKYPQIILYPYALGTEEKVIEMVSSPKTGYLKTGLPHVYDAKRDGDLDKQEFRFKAEMKIPSKLFAPLEGIDYIKCDIEGFEYTVLSEMKAIIAKHQPKVQVEVWGDNEKDILNLFDSMGYIPFKLVKNRLHKYTQNNKAAGDFIFIHADDKTLERKDIIAH